MKELYQQAAVAHGRYLVITTMLFTFLMSLWQEALPVVLVLFIISWWIGRRTDFQWRWSSALPWTLFLYVLHLIGMAWSTNMDYGLFDLEIKLSLLLLTLLGMLKPRDTGSLLPVAMLAFCFGNALAVILGLVNIAIVSNAPGAPPIEQNIFGPVFAHLMHASYFSIQLNFALAAIFLTPIHRTLSRGMLWLLLVLLTVGIVLCGSKIGWLTLPLVLIAIVITEWHSTRVRAAMGVLAIFAVIGIGGLVAFSPFARERVGEMISTMLTPQVKAKADTSSEIRKLAWRGSLEVIGEHLPWGTGTGDVKDELIKVYDDRGYSYLVEMRINAHSQFLQMLAALGVLGLFLTAAMLFVPLLRPWRRIPPLLIVFLLLCTMNWAVESMLEVQAGVLFFAFFALLLSPIPERTSHRDPIQPPTHR